MKNKDLKTYYLEIKPDIETPTPEFENGFSMVEVENISTEFYRYLFVLVGKRWNWVSRLAISEKQLSEVLHHQGTRIYVLYAKGEPVGFFELDMHDIKNIEIVFFGLTEKYKGKGLGKRMMDYVFYSIKKYQTNRLWLHTCELDSENALPFYQNCGFRLVKTSIESVLLPEEHEKNEFYSIFKE